MSWLRSSAAAAALLLLSAQPCLAADDFRSTGAVDRRSGAFAGMTVRLPVGQQEAKPIARLQLTTVHQSYDRESRLSGRSVRPAGLELGLSGAAKPTFYVGGRSAADIEKKLHMKGSNTTLLIVGGVVVLAVLVLASVADAQPTAGPPEGAFD